MRRMSIKEVTDMLQGMERPQLEEMALAYVLNHAQVCGVAGREQGGHRSEEEIRRSVREMSSQQLAELLAPSAWIAQAMAA